MRGQSRRVYSVPSGQTIGQAGSALRRELEANPPRPIKDLPKPPGTVGAVTSTSPGTAGRGGVRKTQHQASFNKVRQYREKYAELEQVNIIGVKITRVTQEEIMSNGYNPEYPLYVDIVKSNIPLLADINGENAVGTVYSPMMGSVNAQDMSCPKCMNSVCLSHEGRILFHKKVKLPFPSDTKLIVDTLNSVCRVCLDTYADDDYIEKKKIGFGKLEDRVAQIAAISESLTCPGRHPKYADKCRTKAKRIYDKKEIKSTGRIMYNLRGNKTAIGFVDGRKVDKMFKSMEESTYRRLGFKTQSELTSLMCVGIIVPGTNNRPAKFIDGQQRDHDVTVLIRDIVVVNNSLTATMENIKKQRVYEKATKGYASREAAELAVQAAARQLGEIDYRYKQALEEIEHLEDAEERISILDQQRDEIRDKYFAEWSDANRAVSAFVNRPPVEQVEGVIDKKTKLFKAHLELIKELEKYCKGKKSLLRRDLMGKNGERSGRSVAGPGGHIELGEVEIPEYLAPSLGIDDPVTPDNMADLNIMLIKGKITHILRGPDIIKVTDMSMASGKCVLQHGDIVVRHLRDGDIVLIGRQPSIHHLNMQAMFAKLYPGHTIRPHMAVTTGYNLDFDGDEMNIHVPQSPEARREAKLYMYSCRNIVSFKSGKPIKAFVYNALSAWSILTRGEVLISSQIWDLAYSVLTNRQQLPTFVERLRHAGITKRTGHALFSMLLPEDFDYPIGGGTVDGVEIRSGILLSGMLTDKHVGHSVARNIIHMLHYKYSDDEIVSNFITDAYEVAYIHQEYAIQTVDTHDCYYGSLMEIGEGNKIVTTDLITEELTSKMQEAEIKLQALGPPPVNPRKRAYYERHRYNIINGIGNVGTTAFREAIGKYKMQNNITYMMSEFGAGAKGNMTNLACVGGALGQQYAPDGTLLKPGMTGNTRCLSTQRPGDLGLRAGGYCPSSYGRGLSPDDTINANIGGRPGIADTATKTPEVGALSKHLTKACEGILVRNGAVKTTRGAIVQFLYGDDGLRTNHIIPVDGTPTFVDMTVFAETFNRKVGWVRTTKTPRPDVDTTVTSPNLEAVLQGFVVTTTIEDGIELETTGPLSSIREAARGIEIPTYVPRERKSYLVDVWKIK